MFAYNAPPTDKQGIPHNTITGFDEHSKTTVRAPVDVAAVGSSETPKAFAPGLEQTLQKQQEMFLVGTGEGPNGTPSSAEDLVVPRNVFVFRKLNPKKLVLFSQKSLNFPLTNIPSTQYKAALKCFESIQKYMGDRPSAAGPGQIADIHYVCEQGLSENALRPEIYLQIYKQLNQNPDLSSKARGWEILCVMINCFLPSGPVASVMIPLIDSTALTREEADEWKLNRKLEALSGDELRKKRIGMMSRYCSKRYQTELHNATIGRVPSFEEIGYYIRAPFRFNVFGETLDDLMRNRENVDNTGKIPVALSFLSEAVLLLHGHECEGIFRVPGDLDNVIKLKMRVERGEYNIDGINDPAVPASLLKLWVRELAEPVIPNEYYQSCIHTRDVQKAMDIVDSLPVHNRLVLKYLAKYLQVVGSPMYQPKTKMSVSNLAMVFAPNIVRCPSNNPLDILKASKDEQRFVRLIVNYLDQ